MTNPAPERIWAARNSRGQSMWWPDKYGGGTEYVRADRLAAADARERKLMARLWSIGHAAGIESKDDLMRAARAALTNTATEADEGQRYDARDAARWRSLMASERIRIMGMTHDGSHMGVEFWRTHPEAHPSEEFPQDRCRERLTAYADAGIDEGQRYDAAPSAGDVSRALAQALEFIDDNNPQWATSRLGIDQVLNDGYAALGVLRPTEAEGDAAAENATPATPTVEAGRVERLSFRMMSVASALESRCGCNIDSTPCGAEDECRADQMLAKELRDALSQQEGGENG